MANKPRFRNQLLRALSNADRARVIPMLEPQRLEFKQVLHEQGKLARHVYFPESGVISLITEFDGGDGIETGTVGNEGFAGLHTVLGVKRAPGKAICQIAGHGFRLASSAIDDERVKGTAWFQLLLRFVSFSAAMAAQSAGCNRLHTVDARMSRWLLMTHDRVEGNQFALTQEFLAQMLGVARPTVNIAGATLQRAGFIKFSRGRITVTNRRGLESASCECYQRIKKELAIALNGLA